MTPPVDIVTRLGRWAPWAMRLPPLLVAVGAVLVASVGLTRPERVIFDEIYYVNDARDVVAHGVEQRFLVHPPLVIRLIAGSITLLGDHPLAWRAPAALAGVLTVLLTYLLVRRLVGVPMAATFAALLLILDGAFVVQARIAMLDIFVTMFVVLAAWLVVVDRQRRTAAAPTGPSHPDTGVPWALLGAGAALGLAVAAKWSGLLALATIALLVAVWEFGHVRRRGLASRQVARQGAWLTTALVVVPAAVYAATWLPWLANAEHTDTGRALCTEATERIPSSCLSGPSDRVGALVEHHRRILRFHDGFTSQHRYQSPPTAWVLQTRPVTYLWDRCSHDGLDRDGDACAPPGRATQIVSLGNLAVWWTGLLALPVLVGGALRRELRSIVPLSLVVGQFLPWLAIGRAGFSYYAVPLVPFLVAGIAVATLDLDRVRRWRGLLGGTVTGALIGLVATVATVSRTATTFAAGSWIIGVTALAGAAVGSHLDRGHTPASSPRYRRAAIVGGVVAVAAFVLFLYFSPVWLGLRADLDAVRDRWWFSSWV